MVIEDCWRLEPLSNVRRESSLVKPSEVMEAGSNWLWRVGTMERKQIGKVIVVAKMSKIRHQEGQAGWCMTI